MSAKTQTKPKYTATRQVGRFGLVGIVNTVIDFGLYNVLFDAVKLPVVVSSMFSSTAAMVFSFVANRTFVFHSNDKKRFHQALIFLLVSVTAAYGIQLGVIYLLTHVWQAPLNEAYNIVHKIVGDTFSKKFVVNNGAKVTGVLCALVWNFTWYKKVVFKR